MSINPYSPSPLPRRRVCDLYQGINNVTENFSLFNRGLRSLCGKELLGVNNCNFTINFWSGSLLCEGPIRVILCFYYFILEGPCAETFSLLSGVYPDGHWGMCVTVRVKVSYSLCDAYTLRVGFLPSQRPFSVRTFSES